LSGVISLSRISENSTGKPTEDRDWRKGMKAADKFPYPDIMTK
jgi:hypothetical protein